MHNLKADTRYLDEETASEFVSRKGKLFEWAYQKALDCLINSQELMYIPAAYIIPFITVGEVKINESTKYRIWYYNITSIDPDNVEKWAIFPCLSFVKRMSQKYISASIAHELSHIMVLRQPDAHLKYFESFLKHGFVGMEMKKEEDARARYTKFREPVKSWLIEWDERIKTGKDKETIIKGTPLISNDKFLEFTLGEKKAKEIVEMGVRKLKERLGLPI